MENCLIEDNQILDENEKNAIKHLIYQIPFYYSHTSTTKKFPYYCHTLSLRGSDDEFNSNTKIEINSEYFCFFYQFVERFCDKHEIKFTNIIRSNINSTYFIPGYPYVDPHVDFRKPHIVLLMYLNEVSKSSPTLIFDKTFDSKNTCFDVSEPQNKILKIKNKIYPEFGKIVAFDGKYYHSNKPPKPGENRIVCVFNLLL